jgi:lipopolysaccharide/colanic/teichoic acid biosynthesis glycosyltransferase
MVAEPTWPVNTRLDVCRRAVAARPIGLQWQITVRRLGACSGTSGLTVVTISRDQPAALSWGERWFDLTLLMLLMPIVLVAAAAIALAIYIDSPGPALYRSPRIGRDGEPFEMLKFRKMRREAPNHPVTLDDDERFTPIGRFLAATRLDELPQAWNVLRGDMRLVGPRPELDYFVNQFPEQYAEILSVTPGITGNAQLRFVDERLLLAGPDPAATYSAHVLPVKIEIDLAYARSHSLRGDLKIIARTAALPFAVLVGRLRTRSATLRPWIPTAVTAAALALTFVLVSSHLP